MRTSLVIIALPLLACTRLNPAFGGDSELAADASETSAQLETETAEQGSASMSGDGDGDGPGDGPGDGDGDEPEPGDGDGDEPEPGDGDGDEPGDGDGDDPFDPECEFAPPFQPYPPFIHSSLGAIATADVPGFSDAPPECFTMLICGVGAPCDAEMGEYLIRAHSGSDTFSTGFSLDAPGPLQLHFEPGPEPCEEPLELDPSQFIEVTFWDGDWATFSIRLPCYEELGVPLFIAADGSTFWNPQLDDPAALWQ